MLAPKVAKKGKCESVPLTPLGLLSTKPVGLVQEGHNCYSTINAMSPPYHFWSRLWQSTGSKHMGTL